LKFWAILENGAGVDSDVDSDAFPESAPSENPCQSAAVYRDLNGNRVMGFVDGEDVVGNRRIIG